MGESSTNASARRRDDLRVVILAAGEGTRMRSATPKVLHEICGRPMLGHILDAATGLAGRAPIVVTGHGADAVRERFGGEAEFVLQAERRGTGHAVLQAREALADWGGPVLILYGDTPLLERATLDRMVDVFVERKADLVLLSALVPLPGRVVRGPDGAVERIVETTDATPEELEIREGNTGVYLVGAELLFEALSQVDDTNAQGEIYLTDVVAHAVAKGRRVEALPMDDPEEALGVNTRAELAQAAAALRRRKLAALMADGVTIVDPAHTYVDRDVEIGRDSVIEPGCVITGTSRLGERVHVKPHTVIESSELADDVMIGPSAHLRPGSRLGRGVRVGNFVEIKNSELAEGVKADHLTYVGDASVGAGAHFGCGAVVVNYDGLRKHRTVIEAGAFVGCNVNLIAPVLLEENAFVAAGSTITDDVPADALGVARSRQRNVEGWRQRRQPTRNPGGSEER